MALLGLGQGQNKTPPFSRTSPGLGSKRSEFKCLSWGELVTGLTSLRPQPLLGAAQELA